HVDHDCYLKSLRRRFPLGRIVAHAPARTVSPRRSPAPRVVEVARVPLPRCPRFRAHDDSRFRSANECVLNAKLLERYWSRQALFSSNARESWVLPDRAPLPVDLAILNS